MLKFRKGFRWSLVGSIIFEISHIIHNAFLLYLLGASYYGLFGSLFAIIYLVIMIADLGFESSIAPFLPTIIQNKKSFQRVIPAYIIFQILLLATGSTFILIFSKNIFQHHRQPLPFLFFFVVIIFEGVRIFCRRFLHNVFLTKGTVLSEQIFSFAYYAAVWIPYAYGKPLTIASLFIPYFFNSFFVLLLFFLMIFRFYKKLPENNIPLPQNFWKRMIRTRYYNSLINIEKFLISGNFLVPFFATTFGLRQAGLFKIASIAASSIKALVKSVVHFPGSALLVSLKTKSAQIKRKAFYALAGKLNQIVVFIAIVLTINYKILTSLYPTSPGFQSAWMYAFIFIFTTLLHQFFIVYEQFYIIEECANKLFFIKSIEFILFYLLIIANKHITPLITLINIGLIQLLCFAILAIHAYALWKIKPYFKVTLRFLGFTILFALITFVILHITTAV